MTGDQRDGAKEHQASLNQQRIAFGPCFRERTSPLAQIGVNGSVGVKLRNPNRCFIFYPNSGEQVSVFVVMISFV